MTLFKLTAQSKQLQDRFAETNCTFANLGSFLNIDQYQMECKAANLFTTGKLFLKDLLNLSDYYALKDLLIRNFCILNSH